jgi:hypothetical protein
MTNPRIFLSYSREEVPFVRSVAAELRARGVDAGWMEEANPDELFSDQLGDSLRTSSLLVVFIGKTVDSPWMNFEIGAAVGSSKVVLPVFLTREAKSLAPAIVSGLESIDASDLKPDQVAEQIANVVSAAA